MTTAPKQSRRAHRQLLAGAARVGLLAYLVVWLSAGIAIQLLHVRSADHGHRYCPEHQQVEDVIAAGAGDAIARGTPRGVFRGERALVQDEATTPRQGHVACTFLNASSSRNLLSPGGSQCAAIFKEPPAPASAVSKAIAASCPLLLIAPKHSPPPASC
ncbi:MAG: hypothetical protein PHU25_10075 [Deltaproteobacteria bacterium]|nr:hypothetical protein [Deltaproteobacteria bacterium]